MKHIIVVAAIIINEGKFLCVQRGPNKYSYISKKFEFPGGKIEQGESLTEALHREIQEELLLEIEITGEYITINHQYPDFLLTMHSFLCHANNIQVTLTEHIAFKWLSIDKLSALDWAAADVPIVDKLKEDFTHVYDERVTK